MTLPPIVPGAPQPTGGPDLPQPVQAPAAYDPPAGAPPWYGPQAGAAQTYQYLHPAPPAAAPKKPLAAWFVLGAGVAAVAGSFMPWVTLTAPFIGTMSASGVDGSDGWVTAGLGVVGIILGALGLRGGANAWVMVLGGLSALGLFGLGVWKVADLFVKERDMRAGLASQADDDFGIGRAMSDAVQMNVGTGLWLIVFAGLVGAVASVVLLATSHK